MHSYAAWPSRTVPAPTATPRDLYCAASRWMRSTAPGMDRVSSSARNPPSIAACATRSAVSASGSRMMRTAPDASIVLSVASLVNTSIPYRRKALIDKHSHATYGQCNRSQQPISAIDRIGGTSMGLAQAQATGAAWFARRGVHRVGLRRAEHREFVASADRTTEQADGAVSP